VCRAGGVCQSITCPGGSGCAEDERCGADGHCVPASGCAAIRCPAQEVCRAGACQALACATDGDCGGPGERCRAGMCLSGSDACAQAPACASGQVCRAGACQEVACGAGRPCQGLESCRSGRCEGPARGEAQGVVPAAAVLPVGRVNVGTGLGGAPMRGPTHTLYPGTPP
jgi:hypothetical protein